ncbi:ADP-ribose pyrophosphatase, mitochondrial-like [Pteropus medius]|uniref:ADP-ribose pyrophosphatase, mitochondrial-like n=1 Tax=Pteropus vampyrus TaxID=132908 RepID=UPI00196A9685|nr:ADP-ribose pyrophosphatase, mitochondrial-like [Pteropus giganteus]
MAGHHLAKALAIVSLTVTLSSAAVRPRSCPQILASWSWFSSHGIPPNFIMSGLNGSAENLHEKARTSPYPGSKVERSPVPHEKVSWLVEWPEYKPVEYTAASVLAQPTWADPPVNERSFCPKFNEKDGLVERRSQNGLYEVENGRPRNPAGRTGLVGRGLLGRWGPNHAADPILTRWKRDSKGNKVIHPVSGRNILQFVAIKRKDCGEWAIPGGMVDPGEKISTTLKREFSEEAMNSLRKSRAEIQELEKQLHMLFSQEHFVVYKGYVYDPRNTDNAWIETEAVNYHDETGEVMDHLPLEAGDDAKKVKWLDINDKLKLYASHSQFIQLVAEKRGAHWSEDMYPTSLDSGLESRVNQRPSNECGWMSKELRTPTEQDR